MKSGNALCLHENKMNKAGYYGQFSNKAEANFFDEGNSLQSYFGFEMALLKKRNL